jgi:hypothetical protein
MIIKRDSNGRFIKGEAGLCRGKHLTSEHKKKIGIANKGKAPTPSTFKKGCQIWLGKHHSEKTKKKMSEIQTKIAKTGKKSQNWKGGKTYLNGYILVYAPENPHNHNKYYGEHRLVMEKKIGRYLEPREFVHHINGVRDDNRIENLILLNGNSEHNYFHKHSWFKKGHKYFPHKLKK